MTNRPSTTHRMITITEQDIAVLRMCGRKQVEWNGLQVRLAPLLEFGFVEREEVEGFGSMSNGIRRTTTRTVARLTEKAEALLASL